MGTEYKSAAASFSPEQPSGGGSGANLTPPLALREPVEHVIHGDRRVDHYAWLSQKSDPRVRGYLTEENRYSDAIMGGTGELQEKLYQEMLGRILQTDLTVPYSLRGYSYYTRTEEGKQYSIYCRRKQDPGLGAEGATGAESPEEVLLDLNLLAQNHTFLGLGIFEISDDNRYLAYATDTTGYRQYRLQVLDLETRQLLPFQMERVTSAAWSDDNQTLFYVVEDAVTKRSHRLFRHAFAGSAAAARTAPHTVPESPAHIAVGEPEDQLLVEEKDERFRIDVERSRSGAYLFLVANSHTTSEVRYLRADQPDGDFRLIEPREEDHEYYVDHHPGSSIDPAGGIFFIRTNSGGRTYRLMTAPAESPSRNRWRQAIPNRPGVMVAGCEAFRTHVVLLEREDGLPYLRIIDLTKEAPTALEASRRIEFAEPAYNAAFGNNPEFDTAHLRYTYESFVTPRSVFDYDLGSGERILRKQQPVLGGYEPTRYKSERIHAIADDGTRVPLSIVFRRDTPLDGTAPLLLYGYGSYGISMPVSFNSNRLSLLERGMGFAIAHIRGGGELGKPWHDAGRMHHKMNTFTDFIAAADHLIAMGYTSQEKLIIEGGSAGGLLMGAVTNLRPDLFRAVVTHVPFVDVLNTMLDASLPLTVGEYEEWGNPQLQADYFYMKKYCPYTNLERKQYPAMLVKTGLNDSQVMYWEPAKYVAKLRTLKADGNPLLLKTNMGAGHGGSSGRYDYLREIAFDYAFMLSQLGISQ